MQRSAACSTEGSTEGPEQPRAAQAAAHNGGSVARNQQRKASPRRAQGKLTAQTAAQNTAQHRDSQRRPSPARGKKQQLAVANCPLGAEPPVYLLVGRPIPAKERKEEKSHAGAKTNAFDQFCGVAAGSERRPAPSWLSRQPKEFITTKKAYQMAQKRTLLVCFLYAC